ncbi:uncharacterized protein LOC124285072 [Haliotis rubra]|uniref:uncharacterized protein LOC124285072 n=1 Tax=Haliotis rubra TaxID=36100 RepID=UPI001EE5CC1F|nr:uncharacterized protein LOC124285072 [Haliotis rubra]
MRIFNELVVRRRVLEINDFATMLLFVFGLVTLSVLGTNCDRNALLYRVDISLPPKEGRDEASDILSIKDTVNGLTNISVLFSFKELGNPRVVLVLDVEKACRWNQLTQYLSSSGYEYSSRTLYHCSDYAKELGVDIPKDMWETSFGDEELMIEQKTFPFNDLSTVDYNLKMRWKFEKDIGILKSGHKAACFRTLAEYPVQLMYFGPIKPSGIEAIEEVVHAPGNFETEITQIQNLDYYTGQCN